jgi:membrane-associated phospholipid phosphatase
MWTESATDSRVANHCFWSHIDQRVDYNASGIWNPDTYRGLVTALSVAEIGGAAWEGSESRIGRTLWQGIDSELISGAAATAGKYLFTRVRPSTENDACRWFDGGSNYSFPSGEAAVAAALVTPYILEYGHEHPTAYVLALVPLYVGAGRVKNQDHWQSDVMAGWLIGGLSGWYAHGRETPITIELLPGGATIGLHTRLR